MALKQKTKIKEILKVPQIFKGERKFTPTHEIRDTEFSSWEIAFLNLAWFGWT
jgi:hypothetical protein